MHIDEALYEELRCVESVIDRLALILVRNIVEPLEENPLLNHLLMMVQSVVKALNLIDRFNYNMDMLGRDDLVILF